MQHQHQPSAPHFGTSVDAILSCLEEQQSLLTGMFKEYVREAQLGGASTTCSKGHLAPSRTAAAPAGHEGPAPAPAPAPAQFHTQQQAHPTAQQHVQEQQQQQHGLKRSRATELPLCVSLAELFCGTVKRVPVQLRRQDARTGAPVTVLQQLQVCVQPGLHAGTRITLPGLGNLDPQGQQSDLTFIVQQQLHPAYRRLADDLYTIVNVPLVTALTGGPVELEMLNGQLLQLPVADNTIITPNSELVIKNQGMPVFGDTTGRRGALHVRFRVCFPSHLSTQQQQMLRQALAEVEEQQPQAVAAAAVATAAGLLPKPLAGLPLLPPSPTAAAGEQAQHERQRGQHQHAAQVRQGLSWAAAKSSWQHAAAAGVSGSPGSSASAWTAAVAFGGGQGGVSAFAQAAGVAACSVASSGSTAGPAACMQSTGSSKEPVAPGRRTVGM